MYRFDKGSLSKLVPDSYEECPHGRGGGRYFTQIRDVIVKVVGGQVGWHTSDGYDICNGSCFWTKHEVVPGGEDGIYGE